MTTGMQGEADASAGISFVMELGAALHRFGTPAHRLEGAMGAVARQLQLEAHILSTPTSIMAGFGPLTDQRHVLVRVDPGEINLEKLAALDRVAGQVAGGALSVAVGVEQVRAITERSPRWRSPLIVLALGALSASSAVFFAGGWHDVAVSGAIGLLIGLLALAFRFVPAGSRVFELVAATVAAAMAHGAVALELPVSLRTCILAGVIALLPGYTLTVAMNEVATRNLVSGTARLTAAAVAFLEITFGVALAEIVMHRLVGTPDPAAMIVATPVPAWMELVALVVFVPAAMIELGAHPRHLPAIAVGCAAAYYSSRLGSDLLTPELGAALGGFALAAGSNIYARLADRPAMVPLVPGLLLLVPGSMGLRSLSSMLDRDIVSGIDTAFAMILVAVSLVAGLLVANATISPRREL
ncbi:MAG TPA: threonine/serine exporter family protein [Kofleriaceae bacterium]|nr:threonine/serine exporter family protein [Kofleriaceae bacterium]